MYHDTLHITTCITMKLHILYIISTSIFIQQYMAEQYNIIQTIDEAIHLYIYHHVTTILSSV